MRARRMHGESGSLAINSASGADSASETPSSSSRTAPKKRLKQRLEASRTGRRGSARASSSDDDTSSQQTAKAAKKARLKKAGRMKRAPLLDYEIVEGVYSAMAGPERRRASRHWLELFAKYESATRPGAVTAERFCKCLPKLGVELDSRSDHDALVNCFRCTGGDGDDGSTSTSDGAARSHNHRKSAQLVDYVAFVDFACNVRDSEKLGQIAAALRESIAQYDGKKQSATSFSIATRLKKLDRRKRGWVTAEQFARLLQQDNRGPTLALSEAQVAILVDRFEYEYEPNQLGIDYMQFAQWLQPLLHLDVDELHERVQMFVKEAGEKHGWKLEEVFEVMDADGNGEVDELELKEALWDMGLPLTDAQIRCLADEYDVDGDGKIQYKEFLALVSSSGKKRRPSIKRRKSRRSGVGTGQSGSESTDVVEKKKTRAKRNVRNTFSWGITKAFARKQAAGSRSNKGRKSTKTAKTQSNHVSSPSASSSASSSPESERRGLKKKARQSKGEESESTLSDEEVKSKRTSEKKARVGKARKRGLSSLSEEEEEEDFSSHSTSNNQEWQRRQERKTHSSSAKVKRSSKVKREEAPSSTESEQKQPARTTRKSRSSSRKTQKNKQRKRKSADPSSDSEDDIRRDVSNSTETSQSAVRSRSRSKRRTKASRSSASPTRRTRSQRLALDARPSSRSGRQEKPRHQRLRRQSFASSPSRSIRRNSTASQQHKVPSARRQRRASQPKLGGSRMAAHDADESSVDNNSESSGLDVDHLRELHRRRRRDTKHRSSHFQKEVNEENAEEEVIDEVEISDVSGDEESSRSDNEYHKHLKRSLRRAFDFFDLDQTASIEKRELSHVLRALGHEFTSAELESEMVNADLDRNGRLDFYEFVSFVRRQLAQKCFLLGPQREMEIRQAFQSLDTDKNGALDEQEFEYLIYKVLQVELSVEEQNALLDFVDKDDDGLISEDEFIAFMKSMEAFQRKYGKGYSSKNHKKFLASLDEASQLAYSAMKKLVRGAPMDIDRNLLLFFGIPSNFRPAISSSATCRALYSNSMEHVLSFPSPQTIESLALDPRTNPLEKKESSFFALSKGGGIDEELLMLQQAEGIEAQAIVSLKRAAGVPKPFDTREGDVVKRCVHVCLFQEQEELPKRRKRKTVASTGPVETTSPTKKVGAGVVVGNVHEIPVYWHQGEEDVWEFSRKATKQDKYKFLVRTNAVNDHLHLLVEFIVHLKLGSLNHQSKKRGSEQTSSKDDLSGSDDTDSGRFGGETREMVCCWSKIPVRQLLAKRSDVMRRKEKLWGGTAHAPVDIEQDELLRRRTGWRAVTNMFTKPSPPIMGIKSVPIDLLSDELQRFVHKMPPIVIAPFVSLPILAEYMTLVGATLACATNSSSVVTCEPVLKLLPKIVDDHEALSILRKVFDAEVGVLKTPEERQSKFQELVLRLWPSFVQWQEHVPSSMLAPASTAPASGQPPVASSVPPTGVTTTTATSEGTAVVAQKYRTSLLQSTVTGKLRMQDVRVTSAPFHVREVAFRRLL